MPERQELQTEFDPGPPQGMTSFQQAAQAAIDAIPAGSISERAAADMITGIFLAAGITYPEQRERVIALADIGAALAEIAANPFRI